MRASFEKLLELLRNPTSKKFDNERNRMKSFALIDGILYETRFCRGRTLKYLAIPKTMRAKVLSDCHDSLVAGGHSGYSGTLSKVSGRYYFPYMRSYVEKYVQKCVTCQKGKLYKGPRYGYLSPISGGQLFTKWGCDIVRPLPRSHRGNQYLIAASEYKSRYGVAGPVPCATRYEVADFWLEEIIYKFGAPKYLVTDRGSQYMSETLTHLNALMAIKHVPSTAYTPWADGLTESCNKDLVNKISYFVNQRQDDWDGYVSAAVWAHNISKTSATGFKPCEVLYGQEPRLPMDNLRLNYPVIDDPINLFVVERKNRMIQMFDLTNARMEEGQAKQAEKYDNSRKEPTFDEGELVWLKNFSRERGKVSKLLTKYEGPWKITDRIPPVTFKIVCKKKRKKIFKNVNVAHMKKYHSRDPSLEAE